MGEALKKFQMILHLVKSLRASPAVAAGFEAARLAVPAVFLPLSQLTHHE
jgi:hypothetical protein